MPMLPITTKEHFFTKIYQTMTHTHPESHNGMEKRPVGMGPYVDYMIHLDGKFNPECFKKEVVAYLLYKYDFRGIHQVVTGEDYIVLSTLARPDHWYDMVSFHTPKEVPSEQPARSHL
jgi:hypothetical protein